MRSSASRQDLAPAWDDEETQLARPGWGSFVFRKFERSPREGVVVSLALAASIAVVVNALFLQSGPHPAPIFASLPAPVSARDATGSVAPVLPRPRPVDLDVSRAETQTVRPRAEIIMDIQRELARKGYYDGTVDGLYGAKTDAAIRDFEQAQGIKTNADPSEALLQAIAHANARASTGAGAVRNSASAAAPGAGRYDPIADLIAPSKRVLAVQRALTEFGYGPINPTGIMDATTAAAVQKFERERKLPVSGEISERFMRELTAVTGRALD